ncbi:MAG: 3-oxoacyl-[acyl-carrier protein] reductase [Oceanicoccus sp.]
MKKTLIITGGSKGIGRATINSFLKQGYRCINISRSSIAEPGVLQINADLSQLSWLQACAQKLKDAIADADQICLIHNAGMMNKDDIQNCEPVDLATVLQVNVIASQQLNQLILPYMHEGSSILYVGSTLSEKAVANSCSYVVSKHAVAGLMRATCQDLAGAGIHTACICPGFTDTEMLRTHLGDDPSIIDSIAKLNAYERLVKPGEIVSVLQFCANNPVINGTLIHANLGQLEI